MSPIAGAIGEWLTAVGHSISDLFSSEPPEQAIQQCPASGAMSPEKAQEYFDRFKNQPDIPFDYPVDCCYTRAQRMVDQISAAGSPCGKVWNYASGHPKPTLTYYSDKVPGGKGHWVYHVAPTVPVTQANGSVRNMVIDPSTQTGPVTIEKWKADQNDPGARTVESDASPYYLSPDGKSLPRPSNDEINDTLAGHRADRAKLRAYMGR